MILNFDDILARFPSQKALVVGDIMLDSFVYGAVKRISPEAPAAVINASRSQDALGGAANVARNIVGLSASCVLVGVVGQDDAAVRLAGLMEAAKITPDLVTVNGRSTTVKMRFVANLHNTHLLRADWEDSEALGAAEEDQVLAAAERHIAECDVVILSDYRKGVLTGRVVSAIIDRAESLGKVTVIDPKGNDYRRYHGVTALTPNISEIREALGRAVPDEDQSLVEAAQKLMQTTGSRLMLVTRSEKGVLLVDHEGRSNVFPATADRVIDVSGAGDTLIGSFALALGATAEPAIAARLANASAGIAVAKKGTSVVSIDELRRVILSRPRFEVDAKIAPDLEMLDQIVEDWRAAGLAVGFTNGCYDLIHPGHVRLLRSARATCDRLVVALNSDKSVQRLKGPTRPVQNEAARATVMAALAFVDAVVLFDDDTPIELIRRVRPDVLIKGADYALNQVVGREIVEATGGRIALIDLVPDMSTSKLVQRISGDGSAEQTKRTESVNNGSGDELVPVIARLGRHSRKWQRPGERRSALFLDRDGVIIHDNGYVGRMEDVLLLPGVGSAIRRANQAGVPVIVASNQSGVGRKMFSWGAVNDVDDAIGRALANHGAAIDLVLYCGSGPQEGSDVLECRKPAPGMFHLAASMLPVALSESMMIGDQVRDLEAAAQAGLRSGLIVGKGPHDLSATKIMFPAFEIDREINPALAIDALVARMGFDCAGAT